MKRSGDEGPAIDLRHGTLDLFILRALADGPQHGYAVITWLREASGGHLDIEEGALYHALHRMERRGWIAATWGPSENNRQARFYRLTAPGRRALDEETGRWTRYAAMAARILQPRRGRA
jgi:transcriptional regulator